MTTYCAPCITELALVREATTTVAGTASCTAHAVLLAHPGDLPGRRRQRLAELRKSAEAKQEGATEQEKLLLELLVHEYGLAAAMDVAPQGQGQGRGQRPQGQGQPQGGQPQGGQPSPPGEGRRSRRGKRGVEAAGVAAGVAATVAAGVVASRGGAEGGSTGGDELSPTPPTTPPARTEARSLEGASDDVVLLPGPGATSSAPESASVPQDSPAAGDPAPSVGPGTGSGAAPSEGTVGAPQSGGAGEASGTGAAPAELAGGLADAAPAPSPAPSSPAPSSDLPQGAAGATAPQPAPETTPETTPETSRD